MDVSLSAATALAVTGSNDAVVVRPSAEPATAELAGSVVTEPVGTGVEHGSSITESLNQAAKLNSTALEFTVDKATNEQVVVVRDSESGDVILQYPSEEALRMIRNLEAGVGGLVDKLI